MLTSSDKPSFEYTVHAMMQLALTLNIQTWADELHVEYQLKNNRIADIYFKWDGHEYIIEVKSSYKISLIENAMAKYWSQCDYLIFAAPEAQIPKEESQQICSWGSPASDKIGLVAIGYNGLVLVRAPKLLKRQPGLHS
jgi:hypothetical protein